MGESQHTDPGSRIRDEQPGSYFFRSVLYHYSRICIVPLFQDLFCIIVLVSVLYRYSQEDVSQRIGRLGLIYSSLMVHFSVLNFWSLLAVTYIERTN
jgi:hypothetical protein